MLKVITIKNFQCLPSILIQLDRRLTILVGPNDKGKSAVLRALRWLVFNRPLGKAFIRHGTKETMVSVKTSTHTIVRKTGTTNLYKLDRKRFKAFRSEVPPEIQALFNVADINFQPQHKPLFWFDLTPGQAAKELNRIVDLESIDRVQGEVQKRLRKKKAELEVTKTRLESARSSHRRLKSAKQLTVKMGKLLVRQNDIAVESHHLARIQQLAGTAAGSQAIEENTAAAAAAARVAVSQWQAGEDTIERLNLLSRLVDSWPSMPGTSPTLPDLPKDSPQQAKLSSLVGLSSKLDNELEVLESKISRGRERLEKKLGGRCPTCGTILSDKTLV
jgi:predicted ATP-dependent endonuclease of OLD family